MRASQHGSTAPLNQRGLSRPQPTPRLGYGSRYGTSQNGTSTLNLSTAAIAYTHTLSTLHLPILATYSYSEYMLMSILILSVNRSFYTQLYCILRVYQHPTCLPQKVYQPLLFLASYRIVNRVPNLRTEYSMSGGKST